VRAKSEHETENPSQETPMAERRGSPRIPRRIPLELITEEGLVLASATNIGRHGALLHTAVCLTPGAQLTLRNSRNGLTGHARVIWTAGKDESGQFKLGVVLAEAGEKLWGEGLKVDPSSAI
jgi:PilZ domain